jgi:arginyl-tRNA synthetase
MSIVQSLQVAAVNSLNNLYNQAFTEKDFQINLTKPEFEGDYTVVLFSLLKKTGKSPEALGEELGNDLIKTNPTLFTGFNIIKGFLNLSIADEFWLQLLHKNYNDICFGKHPMNGKKVMVEYSSPNTNKPLHLGHLRNNFLGWSVAEILKACGYEVFKSCIVNDRGVHICKSMIAWQMFANGATPQSTNTKGDHFVGDYYVKFEEELKRQSSELLSRENENNYSHYTAEEEKKVKQLNTLYHDLHLEGIDKNKEKLIKLNDEINEIRRSVTSIMKEAKQMLFDWEAGKPEVMELWKTMNSWVYEGFAVTYKNIGSDFDKTYYESNTYLLGKKIVQLGLDKNVFVKKEDGSVWIDLMADGLDEKLILRKDGTSVYITQDIGLAQQKYEEYKIDESIYVIGDEQNYHMKVLKLIAQKLGVASADAIHHLSYGMVELPSGKMKSREGTVVDADDLVEEMINTSKRHTEELGKVKDFTADELVQLYKTIGLGAMKFYLLRVDPKKKMIFNPEESIDFHGFTGPFVQYTYARTRNIIRKNELNETVTASTTLLKSEKEILVLAEQFPDVILEAAKELDPSKIANFVFNLAKCFNSFLAEHSIANAESEEKKKLRLQLAMMTTNILKNGMQLLGADVPERM